MRIFIQKFFLHALLAGVVFTGIGLAYAALPEVNPEDNLTDTAWNNVIGTINNFSFDSGNVAVGTVNPSEKFHIQGGWGMVDNGYGIRSRNEDGLITNMIRTETGNQMVVGSGSWSSLNFHTGTADRMFIDGTTGAVGISTITPDAGLKLDVEGKIGATEYCDENGANCTLASNLGSGGSTGGTGGKFVDGTTSSDAVFTGGKVGIGNNDPKSDVTIGSHIGTGYAITGSSTTPYGAVIQTQVASPGANAALWVRTSNDAGSTNSSLFRVQNNGNVAIGTTLPTSKLVINDGVSSLSLHAGLSYGGIGFNRNVSDGAIPDGARNAFQFTHKDYHPDSHHDFGLEFYPTNDTSGVKLIVDGATGNIGIGTITPSDIFHVSDPNATLNLQDKDGAGIAANPILKFSDSANARLGYVGYGNTTQEQLIINNDSAMDGIGFRTNGSHKMFISASGNIGIGTVAPDEELSINKSHNSGTLIKTLNTNALTSSHSGLKAVNDIGGAYFYVGSSGYAYEPTRNRASIFAESSLDGVSINAYGAGDDIRMLTGGLDRMIIDGLGNVGIGVGAPNAKLDIAGGVHTQNGKVQRDFLTWSSQAGSISTVHLKTNIPVQSAVMYRILLEGYNYTAAQAINSDAVGYTWTGSSCIYNGATNDYTTGLTLTQYCSSDGFVTLKITGPTYYMGFSASAWFTNPTGSNHKISGQVFYQTADL